jgi:LacI family transcriptional regulator
MGYEVLLAHTLNNPEREDLCLRRFLARRVDGIFVSPVYRLSSDSAVYREIASRGVPTVILGHPAPFCNFFPCVESDDLLGSYAITRHLVRLGHKRIAFLAGPPATPWTQERFEGYRRALRESGIELDDKLIFQAGRTIEDGAQAATQIINEAPDATAIQAVNDLVAVGCATVLLQQGLSIPGDISVTGFGNTLVSEHFRTPLTTAKQPKFRLGIAAVEVMQSLLKGQRPESRRLPAEIIQRTSSGIPPATPPLRRLKTTGAAATV